MMTIDSETNLLYLSEYLHLRYEFFIKLTSLLAEEKIDYRILPKTNDIWAVDYMPIQVDDKRFIQFKYEPDYLRNDEFIFTQTDSILVCDSIGIKTSNSELKIDGGNVIRGKDWVILTDKIFIENGNFTKHDILNELEELFQTKIIIIPRDPDDFTGHADGVVRYYNDDTVLINRYKPKDRPEFQMKLKQSLKEQGLHLIEISYNPYGNKNYVAADGLYINFLEMENFVLLPIFELRTDEIAYIDFEQLFPKRTLKVIDSREISCDGGALNCVSWNIKI